MFPGDHWFMHVGVVCGGFLDLECHFLDILVSRGRLSTCLVPWGGLGGQTSINLAIQGITFGFIWGSFSEPRDHILKLFL